MLFSANLMFLKGSSGTDKDGKVYYYGSFLDKDSGNTFYLYFDDVKYLQAFTPYKDYDIKLKAYQSSVKLESGQYLKIWKIGFNKGA